MKKVNRPALRKFLDDNGCQTTKEVMATLEPLFQIAEKGEYKLAPAEKLDPKKIKSAIAMATGKRVRRVLLVSTSQPLLLKPEWMTQRVYQENLRDGFGHTNFMASLASSLLLSLGTKFGDSLRTNFGVSRRTIFGDSLWDILWDSVRENIGYILEDSLRNILWPNLRDSIGHSLNDILYAFVGVSLTNKKKSVGKLLPLVKLLPRCLILGNKKDEPGAWLVLVK